MAEVEQQDQALGEGSSLLAQSSGHSTAPAAEGQVFLKKCLTRWDVVFYGVGSTVGAGTIGDAVYGLCCYCDLALVCALM
jgi:hypothetical protein